MPDWLFKSENYVPESDKDAFIDKSILGLLSILSKIRSRSRRINSKYSVNAAIKVAFTFLLIVMLSVSKDFIFVIIANVYLLVRLSLMSGENIVKILKVSFAVAVFTFIILLPSLLLGNSFSCILITSKVFPSVMAVNMLSYSTPWNSITAALKTFFVPDLFILVLDITIKYIVHLGEFSLNMLYALKMRSIGKNKSKNTALSGIAGTLFLKSKEMAEDMYAAMQCRCFTGEYKIKRRFKFTFIDFLYTMVNASLIIVFFYLGRL